MKKKTLLLAAFFVLISNANAQLVGIFSGTASEVSNSEYTKDDDGNIIVSKIIEGINANAGDIYATARKYIENAYKETKYKIVQDDAERGIVMGQGRYLNFCTMNVFPSTYYLCADFYLRVDAKDNRARISLYAKEYTGQRQNINVTEEIADKIVDFPPINTSKAEKERLYSTAFPMLIQHMKDTLAEVEEALGKTISVSNDDW